MVAYPRDILNQRATDLYARIDRDANGVLNSGEAARAVRKLRKDPDLRDATRDVFGLVPASANQLLKFVANPPRQIAQTRIFAFNAAEDRIAGELTKSVLKSTTGEATPAKEKEFSDAMAALLRMGRVSSSGQRSAIVDRALWGLSRQQNGAMREFYLALLDEDFGKHLDAPQRFALDELTEVTVRSQFPIDAWTAGRTKPLKVSEIVHPEFWRRVCGYYGKRFELLTKNASDTRRTYQRVIKDPTGSKAPLKVHVEIAQGDHNLYAKIANPDLHVLVYDGHWELGGNGTQSIQASPKSRGVTKLIVQDGCRTIQNYDEFIDRHRDSMVIGSMTPIFADTKPILDVIFEALARGESLAWVRHRILKKAYFSRNEFERLRQHADLDNDNRADNAAGERDQYFDVDWKTASTQFLSAIEFANTELYYHADHAVDEGKHSYLGAGYGDHVVASGALKDAKPGEVVRVTPKKGVGRSGKPETFIYVAYNPAYTHRRSEEFAGLVTAHVAMAAVKHKKGSLSPFDRMRAIVMGAAAIQFLGQYAKRGNSAFKGYLAHFGLPAIPPKRMMDFLEEKDGYGDTEQARRFIELVDSYRK
jgi:hypothetical protein